MITTISTFRQFVLLAGFLVLACSNSAQTPPAILPAPAAPAPTATAARQHAAWNALLAKYVSNTGRVNYRKFDKEQAALDAYLKELSDNPPADTWSRAEKMAYWINAYNAFTIDLILDNYPLNSIRWLDQGKPWDVQRIRLGGKNYSLNQIENEILRPQFNDARIHFAINCAARSCPPLLNQAYTADNLERLLAQRTRQFINNPQYNTLTANQATVSKIFEWYAADFGDLKAFLNTYADTKLEGTATVNFAEYNWDLNQ